MKNFFMNGLRAVGRGIAYLVGGFFRLLGRILQAALEGFGNILVAMTAGIFAALTGFFVSRFGAGVLLFLVGLVIFTYSNENAGGLLGLIGAFVALTPKKKRQQERRRN